MERLYIKKKSTFGQIEKISLCFLLFLSLSFSLYLLTKVQPYPFGFFSDDFQYYNIAQNISSGKGAYKNYIQNTFYGGDLVDKTLEDNLWSETRGNPLPIYSSLLGTSMFLWKSHSYGFIFFQSLCFSLIVLFAYLIMWRLTQNSLASFLTGLLFLSTPVHIHYLSVSMPEILVVTLFLWIFYYSLSKETGQNYFLELTLFTLLTSLKRSFLPFIALISLKRIYKKKEKNIKNIISSISLTLIPYLFLQILNSLHLSKYVGSYKIGLRQFKKNWGYILDFTPSFTYPSYYELLLYIGVLGSFYLLATRRSKNIFLLGFVFFLINVFAILFFYYWFDYRHIRNLIWFFPFLTLFIMYSFSQLNPKRKKLYPLLAFFLLFSFNFPSNKKLFSDKLEKRKRSALQQVQKLEKFSEILQKKYPQARNIAVGESFLMRAAIFSLDRNFFHSASLGKKNGFSKSLQKLKEAKQLPDLIVVKKADLKNLKTWPTSYLSLLDLKNSSSFSFYPQKLASSQLLAIPLKPLDKKERPIKMKLSKKISKLPKTRP